MRKKISSTQRGRWIMMEVPAISKHTRSKHKTCQTGIQNSKKGCQNVTHAAKAITGAKENDSLHKFRHQNEDKCNNYQNAVLEKRDEPIVQLVNIAYIMKHHWQADIQKEEIVRPVHGQEHEEAGASKPNVGKYSTKENVLEDEALQDEIALQHSGTNGTVIQPKQSTVHVTCKQQDTIRKHDTHENEAATSDVLPNDVGTNPDQQVNNKQTFLVNDNAQPNMESECVNTSRDHSPQTNDFNGRKAETSKQSNITSFKDMCHLQSHGRTLRLEVAKKPILAWKKIICHICEKSFASPFNLKRHMLQHLEKTFACHNCDKKFIDQRTLLGHLKRHEKQTDFVSSVHKKRGVEEQNMATCNNDANDNSCREDNEEKQNSMTVESGPNLFVETSKSRIKRTRRHMPSVPNPKTNICTVSKERDMQESSSKIDMIQHKQRRLYPCYQCEKQYCTIFSLRQHMNLHDNRRLYPCRHCEKQYSTNLALLRHIRDRHSLKSNMQTEVKFHCPLCEKKFMFAETITQHLHFCHSEVECSGVCRICYKNFKGPAKLKIHMVAHTGKRLFPCKICEKQYNTLSSLHRHMKEQHSCKSKMQTKAVKFNCPLCEKKFTLAEAMSRHLQSSHSDVECSGVCRICYKKCQGPAKLKRHMGVHSCKSKMQTKEVKFHCPLCETKFTFAEALSQHLQSCHSEVESAGCCRVCYKNFKGPADLKRHMVVHTGECLFACEICKKRYNTLCSLSRHIRTLHSCKSKKQTKAVKFHCPLCEKKFKFAEAISRHLQSSHSVIECSGVCRICYKNFKGPAKLKRHMAVHTGERLFPCEICDKRFFDTYNMRRHLVKIHKISRQKGV